MQMGGRTLEVPNTAPVVALLGQHLTVAAMLVGTDVSRGRWEADRFRFGGLYSSARG
jgi:hypothetical protein